MPRHFMPSVPPLHGPLHSDSTYITHRCTGAPASLIIYTTRTHERGNHTVLETRVSCTHTMHAHPQDLPRLPSEFQMPQR